MKKLLISILVLLLAGCAPNGSLSAKSTPSPTLDYSAALQKISIDDLKIACSKYLEPLSNQEFNAEILVVDSTQNPGTIQVKIFPKFLVVGQQNTTVLFEEDIKYSTVYKLSGNKVYLLSGEKRIKVVESTLKQNGGVIGYLAQFEATFDLKGDHKSTSVIGCSPIKSN